MKKVVGKYKRVQTADAAEREQDNARKLVYYQDEDGMWIIHAKLPPEAGALVVKAIEAVANPVQAEKQEALKNDDKDVSAETFSEAVDKEEPNRYQDLMEHTRADALAGIAEHFLATTGNTLTLKGLKGSERCRPVLHVDISTLQQQHNKASPAHEHCHLDGKHWISPNTARCLSCDTSLDNLVTLCRYHHRQDD